MREQFNPKVCPQCVHTSVERIKPSVDQPGLSPPLISRDANDHQCVQTRTAEHSTDLFLRSTSTARVRLLLLVCFVTWPPFLLPPIIRNITFSGSCAAGWPQRLGFSMRYEPLTGPCAGGCKLCRNFRVHDTVSQTPQL